MSATLRFEFVAEDVLAAVRLVDAVTARPVTDPVAVASPGLRLRRKTNGDLIVLAATPLPGAGRDYPLDLRPPGGAYSPRRCTLHLPRDADPTHATQATSLFQPALVRLLPAPGYPVTGLLALLRVTLRRSTDQARIGGALLRLAPVAASVQPGRALTDVAGEALLVVPGVPLSSPGPGATVLAGIAATLDALVDPASATFTADADLDAARRTDAARTDGFPDPDDIEARLGGAAPAGTPVRLVPGGVAIASLTWVPA